MILIITFLAFGIFILGANYAVAWMVSRQWIENYEPVIPFGKYLSLDVFAIGVTVFSLGVMWLVMWIYFLIEGFDSFFFQLNFLMAHVFVQFVTSLALLIAGIATLAQWKHWRGIFLSAMATLVGSMSLSLGVYGQRGHDVPILMSIFSVWTFVMAGALTFELILMHRLKKDPTLS